MPFQHRQQCQTCLQRLPLLPHYPLHIFACSIPHMLEQQRASHLRSTAISRNTNSPALCDAGLAWAYRVSTWKSSTASLLKKFFVKNVTIAVTCLILISGRANNKKTEKKKKKERLPSTCFISLIKIPLKIEGASLPHPSFLSSVVKYVNKMSKVILQRGTKEKKEGWGKRQP